ncbi:uncharacterized protein LOC124177625 [Neodiprion fabricii]|uniref:uncharacterized protein LOC124177625 n=1 Tax=Neodiprion fabricii TaxID=2872261 RepID=UPI001ED8F5E0|nr:uncharacterized protein LOC124177625 [Neodiprion fabricii]
MSGSDDEKKGSTVGWVYKLDTKSVVEEFQKRNITVDISKTLATLRKELKEVVRQEIEAREAAKTEKKTDASGVLEKDNSELNASNESFESAEGTESTKNETEKVLRNVSADDTKKGSDVGAPNAESDDDDNMAGDNNKLEFCLGKDDWDLFVERLELLFAMKDIAENKQHIWLLTRLDEEAYKLAKSLCAPILPKDKKYADLKTLMQGHLKPKPSEVMERCTFAQAKQQQNESVAEFEARLRRLALNCNFTSLDTALRDQFVVGIRDEETRISLFRDPKLTFANALKEAVARESAVKNATDATCALDKKNTQREVFAFRGNPKGGKQRSKQHQQRREKPSNAQRDRREKNTNSGCFCCGKANHVRAECRHRDKKCNFCKTIGHLEGVCYKKKEQQPEGSSVHKLDESSRSEEEEQRSHEDEFYSIDVVNNGHEAVIPESMRLLMLKELHASHMGIVKIKMLARSYVWWPGIDRDIEDYVKACTTCLVEQKKPPHTPLTTWPWPDRAWHRIHCDFLGPFYGDMYLVLIDAHTKWPEVINFKNNTEAYGVVEEFKNLFARFGMPFHAVTDGGPQFRATEFLSFLEQNGVHHSFSPPYHPATNGAAENFVETFKDKVHKIVKGGEKPADAVNLFLIDYRSIEHCTTGKSPAQLMYKRKLRTRFDLLRTSVSARVEQQQRAQIVSRSGKRKNDIEEGDIVAFDNHATRGEKRIVGEVVKQVSPSTFIVKDSDNVKQKRHVDQMIKRPNLRRSPRLNACLKKAEDCDVCE